MKSCKHEVSGLAYTRLGLTDDAHVHTNNGLRNALVLNFQRVSLFKTAIHGSTEAFRLQDKIVGITSMNTKIMAPAVLTVN